MSRLFAGVGTRTNLYMLWNNVAADVVRGEASTSSKPRASSCW